MKKNQTISRFYLHTARNLFLLIITSFLGSWTNDVPESERFAPPRIFRAKHIKSTMQKVTDWQLKNPKHAPTDWTNGAFYAGVVAAYQTTKSQKILDSLMAHGMRTGWRPGRRYDHADDIAISQTNNKKQFICWS